MFRKNVFKLIILGLIFFLAACQSNASFTISFNSNGGSEVNEITIKEDENFSLPANPTRLGYTFGGWFFDQEFSSPVTVTGILANGLTSNITVYAKWEPITYTLSYVLNGGENHIDNPTTFTVDGNLMINNPSKTGYAFGDWYLDDTFTSPLDENDMPAQNVTLYAKWNALTYQVTWKNYDGTVLETDTVNYGETPTYDGNVPVRISSDTEEYTFIGWDQNIVATTSNTNYVATFSITPIQTKVPYDGTALNSIFGFDIYKEIPAFVTADVELLDYSEDDFLEVYIDIFDWTEADADAYMALLDASYTYDDIEESWVLGDYFIYVYEDDITYEGLVVYGIGIYGSDSSGEEPGNEFDPADLNQIFGFDIYKDMPQFTSLDADILDYSEADYFEVYIDIFDWIEADADAYMALLDASYTYDEIEESWVLGDYFIYVYMEDEYYEDMIVYGIGIYGGDTSGEEPGTEFDPADLNAIFGYDIYQTMPPFVTSDALLINYGEDGKVGIYIDIFDWTEADADAYMALLDASYTYDDIEESWVLGDYFIYVYEDDITYEGLVVYGIGIYSSDGSNEEPVEGIYYSFNIQDTLTELTSSYKTNPLVELDFADLNGKAIIKAAYLANITDTAPTGLTNGIIFASNVKDTTNALAYLEIDTLGNTIHSISFAIEVRDAYTEKLLGAKLQVFDGTSWVDYAEGDFYSKLSTDQVTITISGFNSSHFRLVFIGAGQTSNGGQFRIDQVNLMQEEEVVIYPTWTDLMNVLKTELSDSALDTLIPELENLTDIQVSKLGARSFIASGSFVYTNHLELILSYINELIAEGFVLNQDLSDFYDMNVYALQVSDDIAYAVYVSSDGEIATIGIIKYDPVIEKIELDSLSNMQSINEFEVESFGESGLPSTGIYDVLVVPVEISGQPFPINYKSQIELTFNGTSQATGWESVSSYYEKSSYGKLDINFVVLDKYTTTQNRTYYEGFDDGDGDQYAIKEALLALDPTIDFRKYDSNLDGTIDSIIFIFSVEYDYDVDPWWAWVYAAKHGEATGLVLDTKSFEYYMWASYYFIEDDLPGSNPTVNAETYIHELGHLMGLIDYYSYTHDSSPVGGFDMMDYNAGDHGPASKLLLGWLQPMIAEEGTYEVTLESYTLDTDGISSAIIIPYASNNFDDGDTFDEYIIIMYYTPGGLYDGHMATDFILEEPGLVVFHVDARLYEPTGLFESYFMYNNDGASDFFIEVLEADKNNSLPGSSSFKTSDMLTSGTFDLSTYSWHQGGTIDISIELITDVEVANTIDLRLTVN